MTIYALASGSGISGVAVIRVSGDNVKRVIKLLTGKELPSPRVDTLGKINNEIKIQFFTVFSWPYFYELAISKKTN